MSGAIARGVLAMLLWLAAAPPAAAQEVKYRVDIEAPETLRELLEQHLDVVRRAAEANVNADEVRRLFARAPDRIRALVATEGYFSPSIERSSCFALPVPRPSIIRLVNSTRACRGNHSFVCVLSATSCSTVSRVMSLPLLRFASP